MKIYQEYRYQKIIKQKTKWIKISGPHKLMIKLFNFLKTKIKINVCKKSQIKSTYLFSRIIKEIRQSKKIIYSALKDGTIFKI